jgi:hypothetical protein
MIAGPKSHHRQVARGGFVEDKVSLMLKRPASVWISAKAKAALADSCWTIALVPTLRDTLTGAHSCRFFTRIAGSMTSSVVIVIVVLRYQLPDVLDHVFHGNISVWREFRCPIKREVTACSQIHGPCSLASKERKRKGSLW